MDHGSISILRDKTHRESRLHFWCLATDVSILD